MNSAVQKREDSRELMFLSKLSPRELESPIKKDNPEIHLLISAHLEKYRIEVNKYLDSRGRITDEDRFRNSSGHFIGDFTKFNIIFFLY